MRYVIVILVAAIVALIVGYNAFFTVDPTEQAIVLRFGAPIRVVDRPGLQLKQPFVENVVYFDRRVLDFDPPQEEVIASDTKRLVVDTYARFSISDPLKFFQTVRTEEGARSQLGTLISGSLRRVIGTVPLADVVADRRAAIMKQIRDEVNGQAKTLGMDVIDVRIRRADLPEGNSQAIYDRMKSERQREAFQFRAQGQQQAQQIRADADRQAIEIRAEAEKKANVLRGEGEAESIRIYAEAFGRDKDFFAFWRSLQAYKEALAGQNTTLVLSPDSEFFRYFGAPLGTAAGGGTAPPAAAAAAPAAAAPAAH
ncbi:MAG TPA: protease modulator HflC [Stellaceae bacterium]|nr:protease modulator HflC [Stellaceae bacterium]